MTKHSRRRRRGNASLKSLPYSALLDALPVATCVVDRSLRIVYVHERCDLFEAEDESEQGAGPIGSELLGHLPEAERRPCAEIAQKALECNTRPGEHFAMEVVRSAGAEPRRFYVLAGPVYDETPDPVGVVFTCLDLAAVRDSRLHGREREAARLEVARQLAVTLNHEINNPLFIVSATLEDLMAETQDAGQHRRLRAALDAVWRVSSAIKQLSEIRQLVSTAYIDGFPMIDLEASQERPRE